jgi:hypothetical protein
MLLRLPPCSGAEEALSEPEVMRRALDLNARTVAVRGKLRLGEHPCRFSPIREDPSLCVRFHDHRWIYIGTIFLNLPCRCERDKEGRDCPVPRVTDDVIVTGRFTHEPAFEQPGMTTELYPERACRVVASAHL